MLVGSLYKIYVDKKVFVPIVFFHNAKLLE